MMASSPPLTPEDKIVKDAMANRIKPTFRKKKCAEIIDERLSPAGPVRWILPAPPLSSNTVPLAEAIENVQAFLKGLRPTRPFPIAWLSWKQHMVDPDKINIPLAEMDMPLLKDAPEVLQTYSPTPVAQDMIFTNFRNVTQDQSLIARTWHRHWLRFLIQHNIPISEFREQMPAPVYTILYDLFLTTYYHDLRIKDWSNGFNQLTVDFHLALSLINTLYWIVMGVMNDHPEAIPWFDAPNMKEYFTYLEHFLSRFWRDPAYTNAQPYKAFDSAGFQQSSRLVDELVKYAKEEYVDHLERQSQPTPKPTKEETFHVH